MTLSHRALGLFGALLPLLSGFSCMLFSLSFVSSTAAIDTVVSVDPHFSAADIDVTFTINVNISNAQNLYGIESVLTWNSSILKALSANVLLGSVGGVLYNPVYTAENTIKTGKYTLIATSYSPASPFSGNGTIFSVTFQVLNMGESALSVETQLYDYPPPDRDPRISLPISHSDVSGFFSNIVPEYPGLAVLLVLLETTILVALTRRKRPAADNDDDSATLIKS